MTEMTTDTTENITQEEINDDLTDADLTASTPAELKDIRRKQAAYRTRMREAEKQVELLKSEKEVAVKDSTTKAVAEAEARFSEAANKRLVKSEVRAQALAAGLIDKDVLSLMDISEITIDDDGEVTGVDEAIEAFKTSKPYLFKGASATSSNSTSSTSPKPSPKPVQQKSAKDMTDAEYKVERAKLSLR